MSDSFCGSSPFAMRSSPSLFCGRFFSRGRLPLIWTGYDRGRGAYDQNNFHLPAIHQFIRELPHPDLHDYPSATTPAYHLIVASIARALGTDDERSLRLIGTIFTLALLATVGITASRAGIITGIIAALPIVTSLYVFGAGTWTLPDNLGWCMVMLAMMLALRRRIDIWTFLGAAILIFAVAMTRQVSIWIIAPMVVSAWIGSCRVRTADHDLTGTENGPHCGPYKTRSPSDSLSPVSRGEGGVRGESENDVACPSAPHPNPLPRVQGRGSNASLLRAAPMALAAVPGVVALLYFFHRWHGLVPPNQRQFVGGGNPAAIPAVLSDIGALGIFYALFLLRRDNVLSNVPKLIVGAIAGAVVALIPPTTHDQPAGRYSGFFNITRHVPILMGRSSLLIVLMSAIGGAILIVWLWSLPRRERFIWGSAALAFIVAQAANHNAFYRYYEPVILIAAAMTVPRLAPKSPRIALAGPLLLALLLATVTAISLR